MKPLLPLFILRRIATIGLLGATLVAPVQAEPVLRQSGTASIYADLFEVRKTASGAVFRQDALTAASRSRPQHNTGLRPALALDTLPSPTSGSTPAMTA